MSTIDKVTTLYRFFDKDDCLLYVGVSNNFGQRFAQHAGDKAWWKLVARSSLEHFPTRDDALEAERQAIATERPRFNVVHNPARPSKPPRAPDPPVPPPPPSKPPARLLGAVPASQPSSYRPLDTRELGPIEADTSTPEGMRAWVAESRRRSGVPPTVEDPATLHRLSRILSSAEVVK